MSKKPWSKPTISPGKKVMATGSPFQIIDSFETVDGHKIIDLSKELQDDQSITQVTEDTIREIETNAKTPHDRIQAYMMKISELVYNFIGDKCRDMGIADHHSIKISGNGYTMLVMMCNGHTRTVAGKTWLYDDFIKMAATEGQIELVMNGVVEKLVNVCRTEKPLDNDQPRFI